MFKLPNLTRLIKKRHLISIIYRKIHFDFDPKKDYYKVLGVEKNSTDQQIKKAYYNHELVIFQITMCNLV